MMRFWVAVVPLVVFAGSVSAQQMGEESASLIIQGIASRLAGIHSCSYHAEMQTKSFGSDTFDVRRFSVHFRQNPDNLLYGYDWEIAEHKEGYTFTFMILPTSWYRIHSGTRGIYYQSLLKRFEPGSFFWTMRDYLILDEVCAPFRDVPIAELTVVDSAGCYWISRQMHEYASREFVVRKETWMPVKAVSRITDNTFDLVQTIAVEFKYNGQNMHLADTAFSPDHYILNGYELKIAEENPPEVEHTVPDPEASTEFLLSYPLVSADGDTVVMNAYDSTYILLDFWYASCIPCLQAMPRITQLAREYSEATLQVFGINCFDMDIKSSLASKLKEKDIDIPLLFGSRDLTNALGIKSFPSYVLITPDHKVQFINGGVEGVQGMLSSIFRE